MKHPLHLTLLMVVSGLLFISQVNAHAPEFHKKNEAHPPNCDAIKHIDRSAVASDDLIMQAMLSQCASERHEGIHHSAEAEKAERKEVLAK